MQFDAVLRTFSQFFERERIRYAVIGRLALQPWGHSSSRATFDFVVESAARDRVVSFAQSLGYETLHLSEGIRIISTASRSAAAWISCTSTT